MNTTPVPPGTIVVGVDRSDGSDRAVAWAAEQASLEGRALTIAHGVGLGAIAWAGTYGPDSANLLTAMQDEGQDVVDSAVARVAETFPELEVRTSLALVDPRLALVELAEEAAMLVVGSRGRGPVESLVLGSVSLFLTQRAPCPVVVLRSHAGEDPRRGVLVGVDDGGHSGSALEFAYLQSSARALPLTVMHCFRAVGDGQEQGPFPYDAPGLEEQRLILDETVAGMAEKYPDVHVTLTLAGGSVHDLLVEASEAMDLVVVGNHPRLTLIGLLVDPHVDRAVAARAPCAVAVVPETAAPAGPGSHRGAPWT